MVDSTKYSAAKEVEDYNYKDQLLNRETARIFVSLFCILLIIPQVGITNREDESVVTSSTLDVMDDSGNYVISEDNVVVSCVCCRI